MRKNAKAAERRKKMRKGWTITALGNLAHINPESLGTRTPEDYEFGYIDLSMINNGCISYPTEKIKYKDASPRARRIVRKGDILMATVRPNLKGFGYIQSNPKDLICSTGFAVLRSKHEETAEYLYQYIFSHFIESQIDALVVGSNYPAINNDDVRDLQISIPQSLTEQKKIAAILRTWDEAIEKAEKVRTQKQRIFKAHCRRLTNPKVGKTVQQKHLSEICSEINHRNDGTDAPIMMISSTQGFIRQDENYDRDMAGDSLQKYILLKKDEFAYNKGNSKTYPYGCIFQLDVHAALIPFVYICFKLNNELNHSYFRHYFQAGSLNRQLIRLISSSVRGNGLLNINSDDFFSCKIPVPSKDYQDKCADFLDSAKHELDILDKEILALKAQKRGLMQKLLTGEWPVHIEKEAA